MEELVSVQLSKVCNKQFIGRVKRAPHWGVQSRFRVIHSRRQYKVSVTYRSVPVFRPYRTFKKRLARPYHFILLGVTQYYCYTRSEYRAESSSMWIFLVCLLLLFFPPLSYSAVPLHSVDCLFVSALLIKSFSSRPFRSSPSIVSAVLARSASVRRLFMLF